MSSHAQRRLLATITRIALVGALVVLLTACFKIDMDVAVSEDDTIGGTMIFGIEQNVIDLLGGDADAFFDEAGMAPDVEDVTTEEWSEESFIGRKYTFSGVPLDEFNEDSGEGDSLTIVRDGDVFRLSGVLDMSEATGGDTGDMGIDPEALLSSAEMRVKVTFPGEVQEANGTIDGNSVTWEPSPTARNELTAVASAIPGGGGSSMLPIIIGILVVAAAVVAFLALRKRQAPAAATAGAEAATAPEVTSWGAPDPDLAATVPAETLPTPPQDAILDAPDELAADAPEVPSLDVPAPPPVDAPAETGEVLQDAADDMAAATAEAEPEPETGDAGNAGDAGDGDSPAEAAAPEGTPGDDADDGT